MQENISEYKLLTKRFTGEILKLFFCKHNADNPEMVLELEDVVGFIDSNGIYGVNNTILEVI